jgi:hypothetical protein
MRQVHEFETWFAAECKAGRRPDDQSFVNAAAPVCEAAVWALYERLGAVPHAADLYREQGWLQAHGFPTDPRTFRKALGVEKWSDVIKHVLGTEVKL